MTVRKRGHRPSEHEQDLLLYSDWRAVMDGLESYNASASQSPPGDLVDHDGELHVVLDPLWRRKRGECDEQWRARVDALRRRLPRVPHFVWVDHASDELRPAGGQSRLEKMIDAPGPHSLRRARLPGASRRKRKLESVEQFRARLSRVFRDAWEARQTDIQLPAPPEDMIAGWVEELISSEAPSGWSQPASWEAKATPSERVAHRLIGYLWDMPASTVSAKVKGITKLSW